MSVTDNRPSSTPIMDQPRRTASRSSASACPRMPALVLRVTSSASSCIRSIFAAVRSRHARRSASPRFAASANAANDVLTGFRCSQTDRRRDIHEPFDGLLMLCEEVLQVLGIQEVRQSIVNLWRHVFFRIAKEFLFPKVVMASVML